jgi:hypothetical protein
MLKELLGDDELLLWADGKGQKRCSLESENSCISYFLLSVKQCFWFRIVNVSNSKV